MTTARAGLKRSLFATPLVAAAVLLGAAGCANDSAGPDSGADVADVISQEGDAEQAAADPTGAGDGTTSFVGRQVTVSGEVEEVLNPRAFELGDELIGDSLLVLSGSASSFEELGLKVGEELEDGDKIVQVTGTVRVFDESKFKDEFGIDYDDEIVDEYDGEHVLVADRISTLAGERVKVAGGVSDLISTVAFRLDGVGWDVVVIDAADAKVDPSDFVQVTGTVQRFDLQSVEKELGRLLRLPAVPRSRAVASGTLTIP